MALISVAAACLFCALLPNATGDTHAFTRSRTNADHAPSVSAHDLDDLIENMQYPKFRRELKAARLSPADRAYFEGILADRENRNAEATSQLESILPKLERTNRHRAAVALHALAADYFRLGRYAESAKTYSILLKSFASELSPAKNKDSEENRKTFALLGDARPQAISGKRSFRVAVRRDPMGDLDVPVRIGGITQWWILDTGANISTITSSTAKKFGAIVSKGRASTQSGVTGIEVPLSTAIIPRLNVGRAIVRNAVVLVMDDRSLDIPMGKKGHYQIRGILGYPVLAALGSLTISGDVLTVLPESRPSRCSSPLWLEELTPLLQAKVSGRDLLFGLDTGDTTGEFSARYLHEFPRQFATLKPKTFGAAGAGGAREMRAYALPEVELRIGATTAKLRNVNVLTSAVGAYPLDELYGNLGQSLLSQFSSYTIDFHRMRFSVTEKAEPGAAPSETAACP